MDDRPFQGFSALIEGALSWLNGLLKAVGLGLLIAVVALNFDVMLSGVRGLFQQLPRLAKVSALGVSVEIDRAAIGKLVNAKDFTTENLRKYWTPEQSKNAAEGLGELDQKGVVRLMNVGLLRNVCRFEKPTADILSDNAIDKALEERKLVALDVRPELLERVRQDIKKQEAATGRPLEIGQPLLCYDIRLTNKGFDARTALVHSLAAGFESVSAD